MADTFHRRRIRVLDSYISYIDTRAGEHTFVLLHGNVASNYVWRDVIPAIHGYGRCLAPDLLGMGNSGLSPNNEYGYETQYRYISEWLELVFAGFGKRSRIFFLAHEWGTALAMRWASVYPHRTAGIAFMEGIFSPIRCLEDINSKLMQKLWVMVRNHLNQMGKYPHSIGLQKEKQFKLAVSNILAAWAPENGLKEDFAQHAIVDLIRDLPIRKQGSDDVIEVMVKVNRSISRSSIAMLLLEADQGVFSAVGVDECRRWSNVKVLTMTSRAVPPESCPETVAQHFVRFVKTVAPKLTD